MQLGHSIQPANTLEMQAELSTKLHQSYKVLEPEHPSLWAAYKATHDPTLEQQLLAVYEPANGGRYGKFSTQVAVITYRPEHTPVSFRYYLRDITGDIINIIGSQDEQNTPFYKMAIDLCRTMDIWGYEKKPHNRHLTKEVLREAHDRLDLPERYFISFVHLQRLNTSELSHLYALPTRLIDQIYSAILIKLSVLQQEIANRRSSA